MSGQGGKLVAGFVALHVLCCGLPLLIAAGAFTGAGALLGNGTLLAAGLLAVLAAAAFAVRRSRRLSDDCCHTPAASDRGDHVAMSETR
jgi:predicted lipid-binding transport protein (Tim44 family)